MQKSIKKSKQFICRFCGARVSLELKPDLSCAWVNKAQVLLSMRKKDEALRCYEEALKYDDNIIQAGYNKGTILASMAMFEDALRCFDAALALNDEFHSRDTIFPSI